MEGLEQVRSELEGAKLQLKSLQRTARTTLQVTASLLDRVDELLNAQPEQEGIANEHHRNTERLCA